LSALRTPRALALSAITSLLFALAPGRALAQDEAQKEEAKKLFEEGRALMQKAGALDRACDTLGKSYELHKRGDTLLNLAECHRRQGKTATAWREFDEAIRYAKEVEFQEAIEAAEKLRDELAKNLSGLMVEVPKEPPPPEGLAILLDGKPLPSEQWSQPLFVDPGLHTVSAKAEGHQPFDGSIDVKASGDRAVITVKLEKIPPPPKADPPKPPPPKPPPPPVVEDKPFPIWAIVVGASGVAMMGVSIGFGVDTLGAGNELDDECTEDRDLCDPAYDFEGARERELRSFGLFVGFGAAGILATGAGAIGLGLGLSGGGKTTTGQVTLAPLGVPGGGGLALRGLIW
jgi:hypothetical protein